MTNDILNEIASYNHIGIIKTKKTLHFEECSHKIKK